SKSIGSSPAKERAGRGAAGGFATGFSTRPRTPATGFGAGGAAALAGAPAGFAAGAAAGFGAGAAAAGATAARSCPLVAGAAAASFLKREGESSGIVLSGWSVRARSRSSASLSGRSGSGTQQSTGQTLAHAS